MNVLKKISQIYLFSAFLFVIVVHSSISSTPSAVAWVNGRKGAFIGRVGGVSNLAQTPEYYAFHYTVLSGGLTYGTHDWIAESVLQVLSGKLSHSFITKLSANINSLKYWYLLGSEIPDTKYRYRVSLRTACGNNLRNDEFNTLHRLSFTSPTVVAGSDSALLREIRVAINLICNGFILDDCEWVAYYMGALVHLVSDSTYYPHTGVHTGGQRFGDKVYFLTSTPLNLRTNGFFSTSEASSFTAAISINPEEAARKGALDTKYGNVHEKSFSPIEYMTSVKLHEKLDAPFWTLAAPSDLYSWGVAERNSFTGTEAEFFDTVEHNLNAAIYYSAAAINFLLITNPEFTGECECSEKVGTDGQKVGKMGAGVGDALARRLPQGKRLKLDFFNVMAPLGLIASLVALALVKKLELLMPTVPF